MGSGHAHALYVHEHSPVHGLPAETKIAATLVFGVAVALTPRTAFLAFGAYFLLALGAMVVARIPLGFLLSRLTTILPFVLFAFLLPFIARGERVGFLGLQVSSEGLLAAWNIVAKGGLGASASIILAATTEVPDLIRGLGRLRFPAVVVSIAAFMMRYLEVVVEELRRMRLAMAARGYDPRWISQAKPIAYGAGALFVRSYERGERVHQAMLSRGFDGEMPSLGHRRATALDWAKASVVPLAALVVMSLAFLA